MAIMTSRRIAAPPRTRVIIMLIRVSDALDSRSGISDEVTSTGVTEIVVVAIVEMVVEEMLDEVIVKALDIVMSKMVFAVGARDQAGCN